MRFLSFTIPDGYVEKVQRSGSDDEAEDVDAIDQEEEEDEEEVNTVRATDWLDLGVERYRQLACDNIASLVNWQLQSQ
jgi:hypothetical protein